MDKFIKLVCCCKTSNEDDEHYLVVNQDQEDGDAHAFPQNNTHNTEVDFSIEQPPGNRLSSPEDGAQPKSNEQEEEDLLNKILHRAQESIIDVSHIDENSADIDVAQRARAYSEVLRKHDIKHRSEHPDESNLLGYLIIDSNGQAVIRGERMRIIRSEVDMIVEMSDQFDKALNNSLGIKPTETLVAYMSMDD
ncbi:hypothetical protein M3Y98_00010100 [Aphelenchoides besseyi]|nr:hypothetical protein M3Y98_00010100 [Aphelenchoides besseyi]KAI6199146.1 hypothetical protein M3Y96_00595400 [Aphelenchoides besseyi]